MLNDCRAKALPLDLQCRTVRRRDSNPPAFRRWNLTQSLAQSLAQSRPAGTRSRDDTGTNQRNSIRALTFPARAAAVTGRRYSFPCIYLIFIPPRIGLVQAHDHPAPSDGLNIHKSAAGEQGADAAIPDPVVRVVDEESILSFVTSDVMPIFPVPRAKPTIRRIAAAKHGDRGSGTPYRIPLPGTTFSAAPALAWT